MGTLKLITRRQITHGCGFEVLLSLLWTRLTKLHPWHNEEGRQRWSFSTRRGLSYGCSRTWPLTLSKREWNRVLKSACFHPLVWSAAQDVEEEEEEAEEGGILYYFHWNLRMCGSQTIILRAERTCALLCVCGCGCVSKRESMCVLGKHFASFTI